MRASRAWAGIPADSGLAGAFGNATRDSGFGCRESPLGAAPAPDRIAGLTSYASRLMLRRCFGEMLSEVMLPPQPPHPSVIAGSSPVVRPIDPCVVGVFTQIRKAGFFSPNCRITSSSFEWIDMV